MIEKALDEIDKSIENFNWLILNQVATEDIREIYFVYALKANLLKDKDVELSKLNDAKDKKIIDSFKASNGDINRFISEAKELLT